MDGFVVGNTDYTDTHIRSPNPSNPCRRATVDNPRPMFTKKVRSFFERIYDAHARMHFEPRTPSNAQAIHE